MSRNSHFINSPTKNKPWPKYPLFRHQNGQWAKKIKGKLYYFGTDADDAYKLYINQKDDLEAGRVPQYSKSENGGLTVGDLVNLCLHTKKALVQSGEMKQRTWDEYKTAGDRIVRIFGRNRLVADLKPADFLDLRADFTKTHSALASIAGDIAKTKVFFNFAYNEGYIDKPVRFGSGFKKPSQVTLRRDRDRKPARKFEADEIRAILAAAAPQMKAMILLGINCGFGNHDCAMLPKKALDLRHGWVNFLDQKLASPATIPFGLKLLKR